MTRVTKTVVLGRRGANDEGGSRRKAQWVYGASTIAPDENSPRL